MKNTRTLISSSIVSIIVVALGLFLLCMGGSPRVNLEDEPLIEGGGVEFDSVGVSDDEFLSLLNDASDEISLTEDTPQETSSDDDIFAELFSEDENQSESQGLFSEKS